MRRQVGFWRLVFLAFLRIVVTLDSYVYCIIGAQNLLFGRPGASAVAAWEAFWQLGGSLGDHGTSRKDTLKTRATVFMILGWSWDPVLKVSWFQMNEIIFEFLLIYRSLYALSFDAGIPDRWSF